MVVCNERHLLDCNFNFLLSKLFPNKIKLLTFFNVNVNEVKKVWQCYENSVAIMIFLCIIS